MTSHQGQLTSPFGAVEYCLSHNKVRLRSATTITVNRIECTLDCVFHYLDGTWRITNYCDCRLSRYQVSGDSFTSHNAVQKCADTLLDLWKLHFQPSMLPAMEENDMRTAMNEAQERLDAAMKTVTDLTDHRDKLAKLLIVRYVKRRNQVSVSPTPTDITDFLTMPSVRVRQLVNELLDEGKVWKDTNGWLKAL